MQIEVNSYEEIGEYLREVRVSLGLDTREIGQRLNIRAKYLNALEEGQVDVLPGKIYARGYLQHYAEFLGLDKEQLAEAFDRLGGTGGKVRYFVPEPTERNYQPGMVLVLVALVVVGLVYYYWYRNHVSDAAADYPRVAPVPARLTGQPVIDLQQAEEDNDAVFQPPYYGFDDSLQGDRSLPPAAPKPAPEAPVSQAQPAAPAPATEAPAAAQPAPRANAPVPAVMPAQDAPAGEASSYPAPAPVIRR